MKQAHRFFNREASWLEFNLRILDEAKNERHPLLERVRFLSIAASNLDEFLVVRMAGLISNFLTNPNKLSIDGLSSGEQIAQLLPKIKSIQNQQVECWRLLKSLLKKERIELVPPSRLPEAQSKWLKSYLKNFIFPIITPISLSEAVEFPFVSNLELSLILGLINVKTGEEKLVLIRLPAALARFILIPGNLTSYRFIALEDAICLKISSLFKGYYLKKSCLFRVIRDSEIGLTEEADDLFSQFESALERRRFGRIIRVEFFFASSKELMKYVVCGLKVEQNRIEIINEILGIETINQFVSLPRSDLKFPLFIPKFSERIDKENGDCFATIRKCDLLIHHPYETFDVVVKFLRQAADDPNVLVIKQTLYRTSENSPIIQALVDAARSGKSVTALVELKARFDEAANLRWARDLESAGVQVVFGFFDLKIHAKMSFIVRREEHGTRSYVHIGTGNYHPITARTYTDLSFFTCDPEIAQDFSSIFNYITNQIVPQKKMSVSVSPLNMRARILYHIEHEINSFKKGLPAGIWMKMNALVDSEIIDALYKASQAGVRISLIVRGICCLMPGIPGVSENIEIKSIVGRFLEHSRIYCFANGEELPSSKAIIYVGSADMMPRNLDRRIEVLVPIKNVLVHTQIMSHIMVANMLDNQQSFQILSDGSYRRLSTSKDTFPFNAQTYFMENPSLSESSAVLNYKNIKQNKFKK